MNAQRAVRVLRMITRLNIGGPSRQVVALSGDMEVRRYNTHVLFGPESASESRIALPASFDATFIPSLRRELGAWDLRALRAMEREVRTRRPTIVHTHTAKAGALGRVAAWRRSVPVVVHTFHGHVLHEYFSPLRERAFVEAERRLARVTDALIAVSEEVRDDLIELGIGSPDRWHVIPVGVDLARFDSVPSRVAARRSLGLPPDRPVVASVGRLAPVKDHAMLLDAFARVVAAVPRATLVIAGDGETRGDLEARSRRLGLGDAVRFIGWAHDVATVYAAADVLALTSRMEGTPVAAIEAGASGVPTVATAVGGVPSVVVDGVTGALVPHGDTAAMADAIVTLIHDPDRRRAMGIAAAGHVGERFSRSRLAADLDELYRELLLRKGIRAPAGHERYAAFHASTGHRRSRVHRIAPVPSSHR